MEQLELDLKDYDLSKSESNENSKVDMSAKAKRGKKWIIEDFQILKNIF